MNFGAALTLLKAGQQITRAGWNGKGMFIYLYEFVNCDPCIVMKTAQGTLQPGWLASQADMLADDWQVV